MFVESISDVPSEAVDLVLAEPPVDLQGTGNDPRWSSYDEFTMWWTNEAARVLRPGGQIYVVSTPHCVCEMRWALRSNGLRETNHIIWRFGGSRESLKRFIAAHAHLLYYAKPGSRRTYNIEGRFRLAEQRRLNRQDREDVWTIAPSRGLLIRRGRHAMPQPLVRKMLAYSSNAGDLVCDLFVRGSTTAVVCHEMGRTFLGLNLAKPQTTPAAW